jgi:type I restriction enzyme M protein
LTAKLKEIEIQKAAEIKTLVKERFSYEIPIAEVEFAGIDSKGAKCENQLIELAKEFTNYRKQAKLWETINSRVTYDVKDENFYRISFAGEPKVFYGKK